MAKGQEVQIKGTPEGLVICLNPAADFERLKHSLIQQLERARDFFAGARFTFYHGKKKLPAEKAEELLHLVAQYGLVYTEDIDFPTVPAAARSKPLAREKTTVGPASETDAPRAGEPATEVLPAGAEDAVLIRNSLRSGQSVTATKHVIVTGDLHPGASITAIGSIIVLGSLLGTAAAGIGGNRSAVIVAQKLAPAAISIAGVAGTLPAEPLVNGKAVLRAGEIVYLTV